MRSTILSLAILSACTLSRPQAPISIRVSVAEPARSAEIHGHEIRNLRSTLTKMIADDFQANVGTTYTDPSVAGNADLTLSVDIIPSDEPLPQTIPAVRPDDPSRPITWFLLRYALQTSTGEIKRGVVSAEGTDAGHAGAFGDQERAVIQSGVIKLRNAIRRAL